MDVASLSLWYELVAGTLVRLGFVLNPCDGCVTNKMIEGTRCTIVDDNKIWNLNPDIVTYIIEKIKERFGTMPVTTCRGKTHTFLGMIFVLTRTKQCPYP
jgi:hypothetical protein